MSQICYSTDRTRRRTEACKIYDPSGNLIEIRTPWDKFVNRE